MRIESASAVDALRTACSLSSSGPTIGLWNESVVPASLSGRGSTLVRPRPDRSSSPPWERVGSSAVVRGREGGPADGGLVLVAGYLAVFVATGPDGDPSYRLVGCRFDGRPGRRPKDRVGIRALPAVDSRQRRDGQHPLYEHLAHREGR